ncbi:MAG: ATPase [Herbinix sp.]|jgi:Ca2+-transporting ATPase|nr:ATPase [Herbinix sp.]
MKYYLEQAENVLKVVGSKAEGLTASEAKERLEKNGKNKLVEGERDSLIKRFLSQLTDPMIIILLVAAAISGATNIYAGESIADVFIILFVVIINAVLGVYQENKAEKAIEALQEMAAATSKVLRDGAIVSIKSEDLVVGDMVLLEAGDSVPADCRIVESASLKIEEAALTGESVPVNKMIDMLALNKSEKEVPLGDRKNMAYMGSTVVYGRGRAVVIATGMDTEMGKIADAITKTEEGETPLQIKLNQLSKILTILVIGICVFIFAFSLIRSGNFDGAVILDTFMVAVSLAVAAIPEGLAAVVTIVLSIGVTNMSKRNAVIRRLTAVETLGCTQIICSDKTGTLTQNKMTVVDHFAPDEELLGKAMALCCDAELENGAAVGEPTECALVNYAATLKLLKPELKKAYPRIGEAPFDSVRKMMSTVHKSTEILQFTKGAPDEVLRVCTSYIDNGKILPMTEEKRQEILKENKRMADQALRVLAAACRTYETVPSEFTPESLEKELVFIGLTGMIDPVRPEVIEAIKECRSAGIRPVMITGDHRDTAIAIATQIGIIQEPKQAITGAQLNDISDEELQATIENYGVYARVQPEHKVRIVTAWKKKGMITAMTGDGVNDAPSIKSADIGVGMGITGTDVTKNVADMVLADDNFATIVSAVEEGRRIYDNIRKAIQFLLSSNLSEVLSIFIATILGFTIMKPVHILWINLITDCFPALALGLEKGEKDLMQRKPRSSKDGIFSGGIGIDVAYQGAMVTVVTLSAYLIGHFMESGKWEFVNSPDGMTMAFLTMSMAEIFHSFNMRSQRGSIFTMSTHNVVLIGAAVISFVLTTAVIYVPFLSNIFEFEHISLVEYGIAMLLAICVIPIVEVVKAIQRKLQK